MMPLESRRRRLPAHGASRDDICRHYFRDHYRRASWRHKATTRSADFFTIFTTSDASFLSSGTRGFPCASSSAEDNG